MKKSILLLKYTCGQGWERGLTRWERGTTIEAKKQQKYFV